MEHRTRTGSWEWLLACFWVQSKMLGRGGERRGEGWRGQGSGEKMRVERVEWRVERRGDGSGEDRGVEKK